MLINHVVKSVHILTFIYRESVDVSRRVNGGVTLLRYAIKNEDKSEEDAEMIVEIIIETGIKGYKFART